MGGAMNQRRWGDGGATRLLLVAAPVVLLLAGEGLCSPVVTMGGGGGGQNGQQQLQQQGQTLISYSYFEKDEAQRRNLAFFVRHGQPALQRAADHRRSPQFRTVYTVSGPACSDCAAMVRELGLEEVQGASFHRGTITQAHSNGAVTLLRRQENVGMDFGNHNVTLAWGKDRWSSSFFRIRYFVFLNSSVRGPFVPSYFSAVAHWTQAFTSLLTPKVKVVGPSLVCLPSRDKGGPGPRLESFVFATDNVGLNMLSDAGVFNIWVEKKDIILNGEYGLTKAVFAAGYDVATLLLKYGLGVNWKDEANWFCNNQVHPSRECSYDGVSQNPLETVFIKSTWGVSPTLTNKYSQWMDDRLDGNSTAGRFDLMRFRAAITHRNICKLNNI